jgi:5'-nucleotidase
VRPLILLSNDDGIGAPGMVALAEGLADLGDICVVAPDRNRSAQSHAITLDHPLRAEEIRPGWWSVDGTPADCMYLALLSLAPRKPDLAVSGINEGYNLGSDFFYSGTVAAAVEASIRGVPAFAISLERSANPAWKTAGRFAHALGHAILAEGLPRGTLLNVNVPSSGELQGYRWTRLGQRLYRDQVETRVDPRGRRYFWIGGPPLVSDEGEDADAPACAAGLVSVTPLDLDLTSRSLLEHLPGWRLPGFEAILRQETKSDGGAK